MKDKGLVSIIIPVYNVEKYVAECIESVIYQTYRNIEIILVNDGSTDNSAELCSEYVLKDQRIKLYTKDNGGLSSARNYGLSKITGDYVFFLDSDDFIAQDTIQNLVELLLCSSADISSIGLTTNEADLRTGSIMEFDSIDAQKALELIFSEKRLTTSVSGKLYKAALWEGILFPVGKLFEDYATLYKVIDRCKIISLSQNPQYYYRPNAASITGAVFSEKKLDYFDVTKDVEHFVMERYPDLLHFVNMRTTRYAISLFSDMSRSNYDKKESIYKLRKIVKNNILEYLVSNYRITSKLYGLLIVVSPKAAICLFGRKTWIRKV